MQVEHTLISCGCSPLGVVHRLNIVGQIVTGAAANSPVAAPIVTPEMRSPRSFRFVFRSLRADGRPDPRPFRERARSQAINANISMAWFSTIRNRQPIEEGERVWLISRGGHSRPRCLRNDLLHCETDLQDLAVRVLRAGDHQADGCGAGFMAWNRQSAAVEQIHDCRIA